MEENYNESVSLIDSYITSLYPSVQKLQDEEVLDVMKRAKLKRRRNEIIDDLLDNKD